MDVTQRELYLIKKWAEIAQEEYEGKPFTPS